MTYAGRLSSSSDAKHKHRIRRELHPQLRQLWATHPALENDHQWVTSADPASKSDEMGKLLSTINSNVFAALVHPYLRLYCELDILMLRPETPGSVVSKFGDIDNQLKTLFDAMRKPIDTSEVPASWTPEADEQPLHCLMEDYKLITRVNVETDRLLIPNVDPLQVSLTIRVQVKGSAATWGNLGLIS